MLIKLRMIMMSAALIASCGAKKSGADQPPANPGNGDGTQQNNLSEADKGAEALLSNYCAGCHSGAEPEAGVTLSSVSAAKPFAERVIGELEEGAMPPAYVKKRPTAAESDQLIAWFKSKQ